jgi:hypothetical protein
LSWSGVFELFFQLLAEQSETAHLVQFLDSTTVRARARGITRVIPRRSTAKDRGRLHGVLRRFRLLSEGVDCLQ